MNIKINHDEDNALSRIRRSGDKLLHINTTYFDNNIIQEYSFTDYSDYRNTADSLNMTEEAFSYYNTSLLFPANIKNSFSEKYETEFPTFGIESKFNYHADDYNLSLSTAIRAPSIYLESSGPRGSGHFNTRNIKKELFLGTNIKRAPTNNTLSRDVCISADFKRGKINLVRREFPMSVDLSIGNINKSSLFVDLLEKEKYYESMVSTISALVLNGEEISVVKNNKNEFLNMKTIKMKDVISSMSGVGATNKIFMTEKDFIPVNIDRLDKIDLITKINNLNIKNFTYEDVYNERKCYNEFLFYKVSKYLNNTSPNNFIQNYYLSSKGDLSDLVDTQTIPGETYIYHVVCYVVISGVKYQYLDVQKQATFGKEIVNFKVSLSPELKIFEVPFFSEQIRATSHAPLKPEIRFLNSSDSENKIRIYFDTQEGEEKEELVVISSNEQTLPYKLSEDGKVFFSSNNELVNYQVFRMSKKPTEYSDFGNKMIATIERNVYPSSAIYLDNVSFNKKYYYTFRTASKIGLYSNPTPIYEVELIRDADETKIIVNVINLSVDLFQKQKNFKQFMQITPALQHTVPVDSIDEFYRGLDAPVGPLQRDNDKILEKYTLGIAEKSLWGRKFKIRVKSNNTGKTIDFNIKFKILKKESKENFS